MIFNKFNSRRSHLFSNNIAIFTKAIKFKLRSPSNKGSLDNIFPKYINLYVDIAALYNAKLTTTVWLLLFKKNIETLYLFIN